MLEVSDWKLNPWYQLACKTYRRNNRYGYSFFEEDVSFQDHCEPIVCEHCQTPTGWWKTTEGTYVCTSCHAYRTQHAVVGIVWVRKGQK